MPWTGYSIIKALGLTDYSFPCVDVDCSVCVLPVQGQLSCVEALCAFSVSTLRSALTATRLPLTCSEIGRADGGNWRHPAQRYSSQTLGAQTLLSPPLLSHPLLPLPPPFVLWSKNSATLPVTRRSRRRQSAARPDEVLRQHRGESEGKTFPIHVTSPTLKAFYCHFYICTYAQNLL